MGGIGMNTPMKPVGFTHSLQQGDWLITYEVVGWNERAKCNIWAEKKRKFSPRPSIEAAIRGIEQEEQYQRTKQLHSKMV